MMVHPALLDWDEIKALRDQGHEIMPLTNMDDFDLVLAPQAWNMDDSLRSYLLSHALPAARKRAEQRKKRDV
jgi:hypothetical protein